MPRIPFLPALFALLPLGLASCASPVRLDTWADARPEARRDTRPGVREVREAKAAAMQEWDLLMNGGMPLYRGDGSSSNINSVKFGAAPGALTVEYVASPRLNLTDGGPQALRLAVYHLSDRAAFDQLARHEEGIRKLLEGDFFDTSVAGVRVHDIQPGVSARLLENRYDGGRYVGLVAGYGALRARTSVYVTEYRLYQWMTSGDSVFSRDKPMYSPYPLHLRVALDETEMRVDDTDAMLDRMRGVTNLQRSQVYARLKPAYRSQASVFLGDESGVVF